MIGCVARLTPLPVNGLLLIFIHIEQISVDFKLWPGDHVQSAMSPAHSITIMVEVVTVTVICLRLCIMKRQHQPLAAAVYIFLSQTFYKLVFFLFFSFLSHQHNACHVWLPATFFHLLTITFKLLLSSCNSSTYHTVSGAAGACCPWWGGYSMFRSPFHPRANAKCQLLSQK